MINKQTTLDLNGPILSFTTNPTDVTICAGVAATFIGIATATFPSQTPSNPATNTGIITYRWYDQSGPLFDDPPASGGDGVTISGAGTTTLRLFNNTRSRQVFVKADYIPSAYNTTGVTTVGTARSTGNAISEPLDSSTANLTTYPTIAITSEPLDGTVSQNLQATFAVTAAASDGSDLSYQWQLNGVNLTDTTDSTTAITPVTASIAVTDDQGGSTTIDFSTLSSYSNFIPGRTYTLVSNVDIATKLTASGAGGGFSIDRGVSGGSGGLSTGTFTFVAGQTYKLIVGGRGITGGAGGFGGGGTGGGGSGRGGGGGGYTGLFLNTVSQVNSIIIAAGGGGGANDPAGGGFGGGLDGGNSGNAGGRGGFGASQTSGGAGGSGGTPGSALQGGPGAAGGGGGYFGGGGGTPYNGCCADGAGGGGSSYVSSPLLSNASTTTGSGSVAATDGTFKIELVSATFVASTTVIGSQTPTLKIITNQTGLNQVKCVISHPTACNSPLSTRTANLTVVSARAIINFEEYDETNNNPTASLSSINLANSTYTYTNRTSGYPVFGFYAPERDVNVELEIYATKGLNNGSFIGGEGGKSIIRFTAKQNEEYIISPLSPSGQVGAVYIYRKASLIAVVGAGGDAGSGGNGGPGGGVNVSGGDGSSRGAGRGGQLISAGTLPFPGIFGSAYGPTPASPETKASVPNGGRVLPCPRGSYWRNQGYSPCDNLSNIQFRLSNGTLVTNSAVISRGHKAGYGVRQTAGAKVGSGGNGGQGATGGQGGTDVGGGGGGSGYTDGSITVVSTQQGGSTGDAKVIFRLAS